MTSPNQRLFFKQFFTDFFHMGAILPSSRVLARAGVAYLAQKQGPVRVLEAGAGTGSFTQEIVPLLSDGDVLDLVEINPNLIRYLKEQFQHNPRFFNEFDLEINFINDDIRRLDPDKSYDYIIFSLPLTNFPPTMVQEILDLMMARLKPGGIFSYVHYIFVSRLKYLFSGAKTRSKMQTNKKIIESFAGKYQFERRAVLPNVPPTWVYYWQKPKSGLN